MKERASVSYRAVFVALVVSLVLSLGFGGFVYLRYIRFEPRAALHATPESGALFVRLDVEQAVVYEPFRRHILSLLEAGRTSKEPRLLHLERKTSLELGVDARELAVSFSTPGECVLAVGGLFRRDRAVSGVHAMLVEERLAAAIGSDPPHVVGPLGRAFTVTNDGVLLVGTDATTMRAAFPSRGEFERRAGEVLRLSTGRGFRPVSFGAVELRRLAISVEVGSERGADFAWKGELEGDGPWDGASFGRVLELGGLDVRGSGPDLVELTTGKFQVSGTLSRENFDRLVARLGESLGRCLGLP